MLLNLKTIKVVEWSLMWWKKILAPPNKKDSYAKSQRHAKSSRVVISRFKHLKGLRFISQVRPDWSNDREYNQVEKVDLFSIAYQSGKTPTGSFKRAYSVGFLVANFGLR